MYDVKLDNSVGRLWCDCRGWKIKRNGQPYQCKHTISVRAQLEQQGWRFERRWDDHIYVTLNPTGGTAARPQPQPRPPQTQAPPVSALTGLVMPASPVPSLEQVRQAKKPQGYEVSTRQRRTKLG